MPNDKSYEELEPILIDILNQGGTFWGKFTCENCGSRQTFEQPNTLFLGGICEECKHETKLDKWGFMVLFEVNAASAFLESQMKGDNK